jgi:hypothetical protein
MEKLRFSLQPLHVGFRLDIKGFVCGAQDLEDRSGVSEHTGLSEEEDESVVELNLDSICCSMLKEFYSNRRDISGNGLRCRVIFDHGSIGDAAC